MHDKYLTLAELNDLLSTCSVNSAQLEGLGFFPFDKSALKAEMFSEQTWRKYRNAKLYLKAQLPDIRAAIGASMRDSCCELRQAGRELANAAVELPLSHSISINISRGRTEVSTVKGIMMTPMARGNQPLHTVVRYAIQCALAEAATQQRSTMPSN